MRQMRSRLVQHVFAFSAVLALAPSGCAPAAPAPDAPAKPAAAQPAAAAVPGNPAAPFMSEDSAEWKAIEAAARKEGEITVYGTDMLPSSMDRYLAAFHESYGVKVNWVGGTGDRTVQRTLAEKDARRPVASALTAGDSNMYPLYQEGVLLDLTGLPNAARIHPVDFEILDESKNHYLPWYNPVFGVYVNTQQVAAADEPKNWKDLLDPRWKGKIVMNDPGLSSSGNTVFTVAVKAPGYGEEFFKQLARQDLMFVAAAQEVDAIVARGERAVGLPGQAKGTVRQRGSPLKLLTMADGMVWTVHTLAAVKDSPAPNAARVLLNWLLSPELQALLANEQLEVPSTIGISNPLGFAIENLKPLGPGRPDPSVRSATTTTAREIFGR